MKRRCLALGATVAALVLGPTGSALASSDANQSLGNSANAGASNNSSTVQGANQSQQSSSSCGFGCGGSGQAQALDQSSATVQAAYSAANADQDAVNANVPVTVSGYGSDSGNSSANQSLSNAADANSSNRSNTQQTAGQSQSSDSSCYAGCGGSGQAQKLGQHSTTVQLAGSEANAKQNAVNANVPVTIGGEKAVGGDSSANQAANNTADANSSNDAWTGQKADQRQASDSSCGAGCGGSGQAQKLDQKAGTLQLADSKANAKQNAVNANVPVTIGGHKAVGGDSSADQRLDNKAKADSSNWANTNQDANQSQDASSRCFYGCGGSGQAQKLDQKAGTLQLAGSKANADQNAVNANVPVTIAGGLAFGGDSKANQSLDNKAKADSSNWANTGQRADQSQKADSSCGAGCGGSGQWQDLDQKAGTLQLAGSKADAKQNAVNANVPILIGGIVAFGGDSSADQRLDNSAKADASNRANTNQDASQSQHSSSSCFYGCGGSGQAQKLGQEAYTVQGALAFADADQDALNINAPISIGGFFASGGDSSANQSLDNSAKADASNWANTNQRAYQSQKADSSCLKGCGGSGQVQKLGQKAGTLQLAGSKANAKQKALNLNTGLSVDHGKPEKKEQPYHKKEKPKKQKPKKEKRGYEKPKPGYEQPKPGYEQPKPKEEKPGYEKGKPGDTKGKPSDYGKDMESPEYGKEVKPV